MLKRPSKQDYVSAEHYASALQCMTALMGEPSNNMINAGIAAATTEHGIRYCAMDSFKAMRDQMIADLEKGE